MPPDNGTTPVSEAGSGNRPRHVFVCGSPEAITGSLSDTLDQVVGLGGAVLVDHAEAGLVGSLDADCAILVVTAENGLDHEAMRLCCALSVLRVDGIILIVRCDENADRDAGRFDSVFKAFSAFLDQIAPTPVACIPVTANGAETTWYIGPSLQFALQGLPVPNGRHAMPFRMHVEQTDGQFCKGKLLAGSAAENQEITVCPGGIRTRIAQVSGLNTPGTDINVQLELEGEENPKPGDVLAAREALPEIADQIAAKLIWLGDDPMLPGRVYSLLAGRHETSATISDLKHRLNVETQEHQAAKTLETGEMGVCNLSISEPLVFEIDGAIRELGLFRLVDRETDALVGIGMIIFGLHRATNLKWQDLDINKSARADLKGQKPCLLWFTGLSGAGKSSVANIIEQQLHASGRHTYILDGDNVRHGLNRDLGFTDADRVENIRRVAETAKLLVDAGLIVMASFISPFRMERLMARELFADDEFIEVFVDAPINVCEERDPKGLYKKARAGLVKNFTGIDSAYEPPEAPEIRLDAAAAPAEELAGQVIDELKRRRLI